MTLIIFADRSDKLMEFICRYLGQHWGLPSTSQSHVSCLSLSKAYLEGHSKVNSHCTGSPLSHAFLASSCSLLFSVSLLDHLQAVKTGRSTREPWDWWSLTSSTGDLQCPGEFNTYWRKGLVKDQGGLGLTQGWAKSGSCTLGRGAQAGDHSSAPAPHQAVTSDWPSDQPFCPPLVLTSLLEVQQSFWGQARLLLEAEFRVLLGRWSVGWEGYWEWP